MWRQPPGLSNERSEAPCHLSKRKKKQKEIAQLTLRDRTSWQEYRLAGPALQHLDGLVQLIVLRVLRFGYGFGSGRLRFLIF